MKKNSKNKKDFEATLNKVQQITEVNVSIAGEKTKQLLYELYPQADKDFIEKMLIIHKHFLWIILLRSYKEASLDIEQVVIIFGESLLRTLDELNNNRH